VFEVIKGDRKLVERCDLASKLTQLTRIMREGWRM